MRTTLQVDGDRPRPEVPVFDGGTGPRPGIDLSSNRALYEVLDEDLGLNALK